MIVAIVLAVVYVATGWYSLRAADRSFDASLDPRILEALHDGS